MPKILVAKEKDVLGDVNLQSTWAPVSFMGYKDRVSLFSKLKNALILLLYAESWSWHIDDGCCRVLRMTTPWQ